MNHHSTGSFINGFHVGILTLQTRHPLYPGNVQHAASFGFPVVYEPVVDLADPGPLMRGEPWLKEPIVAAAQRLEQLNVAVIMGSCGSFAYYQRAVADAVSVPVFLSIMMQVPLILNGLGQSQRLCIICGDINSMNERVFEQCGITDTSRILFKSLMEVPQFRCMVRGEQHLDMAEFETDIVAIAQEALREQPTIGAFLLQCSDTPPFGRAVQEATGRAVFDMTLMIRWIESAAHYPIYNKDERMLSAVRIGRHSSLASRASPKE